MEEIKVNTTITGKDGGLALNELTDFYATDDDIMNFIGNIKTS